MKDSKKTVTNTKQKTSTKPKVLFALVEAEPFMKTGGLGDVGGSLPAALSRAGADVSVILPKFSGIDDEYKDKMEFLGVVYVTLSWRQAYCGVFKLVQRGITYYFLDNEHYFRRDALYGYGDDAERMAFFSKGILEALPLLEEFPNIIHCHDWHTALLPVFLRENFMNQEKYCDVKTIFTIHNLKYQGVFAGSIISDVLGLHDCPSAVHQIEYWGAVNYMRGALLYSDRLTTVSPTYAEEIKTTYFGEHMENIFRERESVLSGILNGINTAKFDPKKDPDIYVNYGLKTFEQKAENKTRLQADLGLPVDKDIPLLCVVSRLTEQKGLDLITHICDELSTLPMQLAILGTGEPRYEEAFRWFMDKYSDKINITLKFSESLSHKFYAGADMLLMPSRFEPCGLSQMIAMGYGTLPIVRSTGGLRDSVIPYNKETGEGNGFSFDNYNAHELFFTIKEALELYENDRKTFKNIQKNAMRADFKWSTSADKYIDIYNDLLNI